MKAKPIQTVQINFEFRSSKDLLEMFDQIRKEIASGERNVSSNFRGLPYRVRVLNASKITPITSELMGGKRVEIYPSKMNRNE